jgi:hypothetical protein
MESEFHRQHQQQWLAATGGAALVVWGARKMTTDQPGAAALFTSVGAGLLLSRLLAEPA